jgi:hypothetical protein
MFFLLEHRSGIYIELRNLLDGGPQSCARNSILHIAKGRGRMTVTDCQVIDNVLGYYMSTDSDRAILILDWMKGTTVTVRLISPPKTH